MSTLSRWVCHSLLEVSTDWVQLLAAAPSKKGGLQVIANGLFHRYPGIRESTADILLNLQAFEVGLLPMRDLQRLTRADRAADDRRLVVLPPHCLYACAVPTSMSLTAYKHPPSALMVISESYACLRPPEMQRDTRHDPEAERVARTRAPARPVTGMSSRQ